MKKFFKFALGAASVAAVVGGVYYFLKKNVFDHIKDEDFDDFDDFDDPEDFDDFEEFDDTDDNVVPIDLEETDKTVTADMTE